MKVAVRPYISSGIAVATVGAFVASPTPARVDPPVHPREPAVALAAQVQPVVTSVPVPSPQQLTAPLTEQVAFHVDLAVDFVVKGAELVGRQVPVPGTLLRDIGNGTPLPTAVSRALTTLAVIELDAGRELVGFGTRYVDFQVRFVANAVSGAVALATAVPVAVTELAAATIAGLMPAPATSSDTVTSAALRASDEEATGGATGDIVRAKPATTARHSGSADTDDGITSAADDSKDDEDATERDAAETTSHSETADVTVHEASDDNATDDLAADNAAGDHEASDHAGNDDSGNAR